MTVRTDLNPVWTVSSDTKSCRFSTKCTHLIALRSDLMNKRINKGSYMVIFLYYTSFTSRNCLSLSTSQDTLYFISDNQTFLTPQLQFEKILQHCSCWTWNWITNPAGGHFQQFNATNGGEIQYQLDNRYCKNICLVEVREANWFLKTVFVFLSDEL